MHTDGLPEALRGALLLVDEVGRDVRYAARSLRASPIFAAVAVLSIALAVGVNTGLFAVVHAVLLRPLPVSEPNRLLFVFTGSRDDPYGPTSYPDYADLREASRGFDALAAYGEVAASIRLDDMPEVVRGLLVSGNFFEVLGVHAADGRVLSSADDDHPGAHPVAVLGHSLWQRRFSADRSIVGRDIAVNGHPFTVVGVTAPGFRGPEVLETYELFVPLVMQASVPPARAGPGPARDTDRLSRRDARWLRMIGRVTPSAGLDHAQAELRIIASRLSSSYADTNRDLSVTVFPVEKIDPRAFGPLVAAATVLMIMGSAVLLVALANVSSLSVVRALSRQREVATRLALGAGWVRLVRPLLMEAVLLAVAGGALGIIAAMWMLAALNATRPTTGIFELSLGFTLDHRVLIASLLVSTAAAMVLSLIPARHSARTDLAGVLRRTTGTLEARAGRATARRALLVAQLAISVMLLVAAGLFGRSLVNARAIDLGFDADRLLTMDVRIDLLHDSETGRRPLVRDVRESVAGLPGVEAASLARALPLGGGGRVVAFAVDATADRALDPRTMPTVAANAVHTNYFRVMGIPLLRGREFSERDDNGAPLAVVVNETFMRRFLADGNVLGRRLRLGGADAPWSTVVGVVRDSKYRTIGEPATPFVYQSLDQTPGDRLQLLVRAFGDPRALIGDVRQRLRALDPDIPTTDLEPMMSRLDSALFPTRTAARLAGLLGILATVLAVTGLFGVTSFVVAQRSREVGIRIALGARSKDIGRLIVGETAIVIGVGVTLGCVGAAFVSRLLAGFLYGIGPSDPLTFAAVAVTMTCVMGATAYGPARRAARTDPMIQLRRE